MTSVTMERVTMACIACAGLAALAAACTRGVGPRDRNGDNVVRLVCIGDSNTDAGPKKREPKWCELLATRHPDLQFVNYGKLFMRASGDCFLCGQTVTRQALATERPDAVLIALGTNDLVMAKYGPEATVAALVFLRDLATQANADALIATIPPVLNGDAALNAQIDATNALLAQRIAPKRLVDFHRHMVAADFYPEGIHLNRGGQEKRAAAAHERLTDM